MQCPRCAAILAAGFRNCPRCGFPVTPVPEVVGLTLVGNAWQVLGWMLLAGLTSLIGRPLFSSFFANTVCVSCVNVAKNGGPWLDAFSGVMAAAGAWVLAAIFRWFCRSLQLSNGDQAEFHGRAEQIVGWLVLGYLLRFNPYGWGVIDFLGGVLILWKVVRWFVNHIQFRSGPAFSFTGRYLGLVGWSLLNALLLLTIIGWAWSMAAMYRWFAEHTEAEGAVLTFHGEGRDVLLRSIAVALMTCTVVLIPWAWLWYARWLVRSTTLQVNVATAARAA